MSLTAASATATGVNATAIASATVNVAPEPAELPPVELAAYTRHVETMEEHKVGDVCEMNFDSQWFAGVVTECDKTTRQMTASFEDGEVVTNVSFDDEDLRWPSADSVTAPPPTTVAVNATATSVTAIGSSVISRPKHGTGRERPMTLGGSSTGASKPANCQRQAASVRPKKRAPVRGAGNPYHCFRCEDCALVRASFGLPTEGRKRWCSKCASAHAGARDLVHAPCVDCGLKRPSWGLPPAKGCFPRRIWCAGCARTHAGARDPGLLNGRQGFAHDKQQYTFVLGLYTETIHYVCCDTRTY